MLFVWLGNLCVYLSDRVVLFAVVFKGVLSVEMSKLVNGEG